MRVLILMFGVMFAWFANASDSNRTMSIVTANDLYEKCKSAVEILQGAAVGEDKRVIESATCLSYITGFRDGSNTSTAYFAIKMKGTSISAQDIRDVSIYCDNTNVTTGAIAKAVVNILEKSPEKRKMMAGVILMQIMKAGMPCKSQEQK